MAELLTDANAPDPVLPGSSFIIEAQVTEALEQSIGSTVFVPITSNWGPDGEAVHVDRYLDFLRDDVWQDESGATRKGFGAADTAGRRAVFGAFLGEGLPGRGGAGAALVYRLCAAAGAKATKVLQNTTPVNAVTFTAKYKGTRGNGFQFTVRPGSAGLNELVIIEGGREREVYPHPTTDLASLVADVNANSSYFDAVLNADGVALAAIAGTAAAGGNDGAAYTAGDFTAMLSALEFEPFSVFSAHGITDTGIIASLLAWKNDVKARGKSVFLAIGGAAAETFSAHQSRAAGYNDDDTIAFGTGNIADSTLSADGSEVTISTAEGVSRVAGAVARRGEIQDMVNVRFAGWRSLAGANLAQAKIAVSSGMSVLIRDGDRNAPTKIGLAPTSYTGDTAAKPRRIYSVVKFVRTLHGLESDITAQQEGGDDELIDGRGVTAKSRDLIRGRAKAAIKDRVSRGILQPGSDADFDPDRPPSPTDTIVALVYDAVFVRGLRGIRNRIRVG